MFKRVVDRIEENRNVRLRGDFNCIPWELPRFEIYNPGIRQERYFIVSASSKVGKTQITDQLFMYNPYDFIHQNKTNIKLKIFYFTLEMSKEEKLAQAISRKLYMDSEGEIRISPTDLMSLSRDKILSENILDKIKDLEEYFDKFNECVTFIDSIRNPYGIYEHMRKYAEANGTQYKKTITIKNKENKKEEIQVDDYYEPNDPNEYVIIIIDHARLLTRENGQSLRETISNLSSNYCIKMRNKWRYIPVLVQQQAAAQESLDRFKANKLAPSLDGLGDNKTTQQDANTILGLFAPFRHKIEFYPNRKSGYDIYKFKDHIRFLEILASRDGGAGTICPLYFDGAVNFFQELPPSDSTAELQNIYSQINEIS